MKKLLCTSTHAARNRAYLIYHDNKAPINALPKHTCKTTVPKIAQKSSNKDCRNRYCHQNFVDLAQQLLNIFNPLHPLFLITHHAQGARTKSQVSAKQTSSPWMDKRGNLHKLFPLLNPQHLLLNTTVDHKPHNLDLVFLTHAMHTINRLGLDCKTPPRIHHEYISCAR